MSKTSKTFRDVTAVRNRMRTITTTLMDKNAPAYVVGYLESTLVDALFRMPTADRARFIECLEDCVLPKTKMVESLMTGEMVEIPRNTPICLDPSRETYWSM